MCQRYFSNRIISWCLDNLDRLVLHCFSTLYLCVWHRQVNIITDFLPKRKCLFPYLNEEKFNWTWHLFMWRRSWFCTKKHLYLCLCQPAIIIFVFSKWFHRASLTAKKLIFVKLSKFLIDLKIIFSHCVVVVFYFELY